MTDTLVRTPVTPETPAVMPERVTPLLPSEALELGRLMRPRRLIGALFSREDGACALGAMAAAVGSDGYPTREMPGLETRWWVPCPVFRCPSEMFATAVARGTAKVYSIVWHLNDWHEWSDAAIGAYLRELGL